MARLTGSSRKLIEGKNPLFIATVGRDRSPQLRATKADAEREHVLIDASVSIESMAVDPLNVFANEKYVNLESYKKNGEAIQTPVWFVEKDRLIYVHTAQKTWKVKRVTRNPQVRIVPSSFRGRPKGKWFRGEAQLTHGTETGEILRLFNKKYGLTGRLIVFIEKLVSGNRILISIKLKDEN